MSINKDQYYTNPKTANICWNKLLKTITMDQNLIFVEPSAGTGSFVRTAPKTIKILAFDIDPKYSLVNSTKISKRDFLSLKIGDFPSNSHLVFIGNPPFGKRSQLALQFINKMVTLSKNPVIIGMILPRSFSKYQTQSYLNVDLNLLSITNLNDAVFIHQNSQPIKRDIRTAFYLFSTDKNTDKEDIRIRDPYKAKYLQDYQIRTYNDTPKALPILKRQTFKWDLAVLQQGYGNYSSIYQASEAIHLSEHQHWLLIKLENPISKLIFEKIDYQLLSMKNSTTIPGYGLAEIREAYDKLRESATSRQ